MSERDSNPRVGRLLRHGQRVGCVEMSRVQDLVGEMGLDDEGEATVLELLAEHGVEVKDDCGRGSSADVSYGNGDLARATSDAIGLFLGEIGRYPLLTADEEVALAKRIEKDDRDAREQMILSNLRLVVYWAKRYQGQGVALLDLIQEGVFGLMRAVKKFDWRRGFKFSTYATWWIRQSLQRAVQGQAREIRVPLEMAERGRRIERTRAELRKLMDHEPNDEDIAAAIGLSVRDIEAVRNAARVVTSLDQPVGEEGDVTLGQFAARDESFEESLHVDLQEKALVRAVDDLPEPHRTIIRRRYGLGGVEPVGRYRLGRELHMADRTIKALEEEALQRLASERELAAIDAA